MLHSYIEIRMRDLFPVGFPRRSYIMLVKFITRKIFLYYGSSTVTVYCYVRISMNCLKRQSPVYQFVFVWRDYLSLGHYILYISIFYFYISILIFAYTYCLFLWSYFLTFFLQHISYIKRYHWIGIVRDFRTKIDGNSWDKGDIIFSHVAN